MALYSHLSFTNLSPSTLQRNKMYGCCIGVYAGPDRDAFIRIAEDFNKHVNENKNDWARVTVQKAVDKLYEMVHKLITSEEIDPNHTPDPEDFSQGFKRRKLDGDFENQFLIALKIVKDQEMYKDAVFKMITRPEIELIAWPYRSPRPVPPATDAQDLYDHVNRVVKCWIESTWKKDRLSFEDFVLGFNFLLLKFNDSELWQQVGMGGLWNGELDAEIKESITKAFNECGEQQKANVLTNKELTKALTVLGISSFSTNSIGRAGQTLLAELSEQFGFDGS